MMKRKCVLGVLKTEEGLRIKEEMLSWLNEKYDVTLVEVDPPNELYEFPFIKKAVELAITSNEPVLYLHTKGAAMQNSAQPMVREFWKHEFTENIDKYFDMPEKATVIAPYTLHKKIAWFNAFTINHEAAKCLITYLKPHQDRYWFEQKIWNETDAIDVIGIHDSIVECEDPWQAFLQLFNLMKQGKLIINPQHKDNFKAVISLTSWKKRIVYAHKTIENLKNMCPGFHIVLTLSEDEFINKEKDLPSELVNDNDIEILWVKENMRAFKKILYTIAKYPTVPVIAADDDCFYTENYAQRLYDAWLSNDKIHQIYTYHVDQNCWPYRFGNGPACLYPPSCFGQYGLKLLTQAIVDTNHDDLYYGTLAFKLHIPIVEVAKRRPYEFHDEIEGLSSTKIKDGIVCLKICISEIDNVINKL